jgi:hypothetical protein
VELAKSPVRVSPSYLHILDTVTVCATKAESLCFPAHQSELHRIYTCIVVTVLGMDGADSESNLAPRLASQQYFVWTLLLLRVPTSYAEHRLSSVCAAYVRFALVAIVAIARRVA